MATITINGNSMDPLAQAAALQDLGMDSLDTSQSDYILLQASEPLTKIQKQQLKDLDVTILEYVPDNSYVAYYPPKDLTPVRRLPFLSWAGLYPMRFKVEPALRPQRPGVTAPRVVNALTAGAAESDPLAHDPKTVELVLHGNAQPDEIRNEIAKAA